MRGQTHRVFCFAWTSLVIAGCQNTRGDSLPSRCETVPAVVATAALAVFGGDASCESLGPEKAAIGYLLTTDEQNAEGEPSRCTVARVAPGVAVTAKHCLPLDPNWVGVVGFAPRVADLTGCGHGSGEAWVSDYAVHPEVDLALLRFSESPDDANLQLAVVHPGIRDTIVIAGFGLTETGTIGERRCVDSQLEADDLFLVAHSKETGKGACVGDSGGPLLYWNDRAAPVLAGVLSDGSASCAGLDRYVSLMEEHEWVTAISSFWRGD